MVKAPLLPSRKVGCRSPEGHLQQKRLCNSYRRVVVGELPVVEASIELNGAITLQHFFDIRTFSTQVVDVLKENNISSTYCLYCKNQNMLRSLDHFCCARRSMMRSLCARLEAAPLCAPQYREHGRARPLFMMSHYGLA